METVLHPVHPYAELDAVGELERDAERFEHLHAVAVALSRALTMDEVAAAAASHGAALTRGSGCAVGVRRGDVLALVARRRSGRAPPWPDQVAVSAELPLAQAVRENQPLFLQQGAEGAGALAILPLVCGRGGSGVGVVAIAFEEPRAFDPEERAFLEAFAHHCAEAFERARLFEAERTARLEAEQAKDAAQRALETRDRLAGIVAHDLRTPLAAIRLSLAVLFGRGGLGEEQVRTLARIATSSGRMTRIVRDLLDFSRLSAGLSIPVELRIADVGRIVRRAVAELRTAHPECDIHVESSARAEARVDPERLVQVVSNVVGNAIQHGVPDAPILVEVKPGGPEVQVTVQNRGPPIEGDPEELFDPFRRGAHAAGSGSAGLGLFIVREVVRAHGGAVEVRSSEGEGTIFTMRFPSVGEATTGRPAPER